MIDYTDYGILLMLYNHICQALLYCLTRYFPTPMTGAYCLITLTYLLFYRVGIKCKFGTSPSFPKSRPAYCPTTPYTVYLYRLTVYPSDAQAPYFQDST